eukprot:6173064-Pleurochrysis_carterae.AAC.3
MLAQRIQSDSTNMEVLLDVVLIRPRTNECDECRLRLAKMPHDVQVTCPGCRRKGLPQCVAPQLVPQRSRGCGW